MTTRNRGENVSKVSTEEVEVSVTKDCKEEKFLNVKKGDKVHILPKKGNDNYMCSFNGTEGLLPNYCLPEFTVTKDFNNENESFLKVKQRDKVLYLHHEEKNCMCFFEGRKGLVPQDHLTGDKSVFKKGETKYSSFSKIKLGKCAFLVLMLFVFAICMYFVYNSSTVENDSLSLIVDLKKKFNNQQSNLWTNLDVCLDKLKKEKKLCVLLLLHKEDAQTFDYLIKQLVHIPETILKKNKTIYINGNDIKSILGSNESFLTHYKQQLRQSSIMVIKHLESIPSNVFRSFHSLCDEENPAVENAVIFLLLLTDDLKHAANIKSKAEMTIKEKWSDLPYNILDPLSARLTVFVSELVPPTN